VSTISISSIRNGLIEPRAHRRRKVAWGRWERDQPMQLWQMDVMGGIWLTDGRELRHKSAGRIR
jgi:hypothetical protein